jgi:cytochrome subunit of sulfide dehydrogenase
MKAFHGIIALAAVALAIAPARAASLDAPAGAASCSGCHAPAGVDTPVPPLNGRAAADIVAQMQAFKRGQKQATVMDRLAKGYDDAEIQAIAAWYAAQR